MAALLHSLVILTAFLFCSCKSADISPQKGRRSGRHEAPSTNSFKYQLWNEDFQSSVTRPASRKPSDRYILPWRSYEEWKRSQEMIEEEIDLILKSGHFRKPGKKTRLGKREKHRPKMNKNRKSLSKYDRRKSTTSERRLKTAKRKKSSRKSLNDSGENSTKRLDRKSAMGGSVLSVKYFSTEESSGETYTTAMGENVNANDTIQTEIVNGISNLTISPDQQVLAAASFETMQMQDGNIPERDHSGSTTRPTAGFRKMWGTDKFCMPVNLSARFNSTHVCIFGPEAEQFKYGSEAIKFDLYACKRTEDND